VATKFLVKISQSGHQNIIFDALSEIQKDLEDISEGIGTFLKIRHIKILLEFDVKVGVVNFDLALYN
jgi:hypothetical protein